MKAKKVLFINQEITPYVPESEMSHLGRALPQAIQEKGYEIRTFMPKWGNINERRGQLHTPVEDDAHHRRDRPSAYNQGRVDTVNADTGVFHRQRGLFHETPDGVRRERQRI